MVTIPFLLFSLAGAVRPDALIKPWDKNSAVISYIVTRDIPQEFSGQHRYVYIESISASEMRSATNCVCYPDHRLAPDYVVDGIYIGKPSDGAELNCPAYGSEIYVLDTLTPRELAICLTHEFGHYVYYEFMSDAERTAWLAVWQQGVKDKNLPSDYAGYNAQEGFAEAFRFWVLDRSKLSAPMVTFIGALSTELKGKL